MIQGDKYFLKKLQFQIIGPRIIHGQFYLKLIKKDVLRLQLNHNREWEGTRFNNGIIVWNSKENKIVWLIRHSKFMDATAMESSRIISTSDELAGSGRLSRVLICTTPLTD